MPIETVPGADLVRYYLIAFDEAGDERDGDPDSPDGLLSHRLLHDLRRKAITDVFILSHGWKGDIPAAREQYGRWIQAMAACEADQARMRAMRKNFEPLVIGLHWPSLPWGEEELGPASPAFAPGVTGVSKNAIDALIEAYARRTAHTDKAHAALVTIFQAALKDIAPSRLPPDVRAAYEALDAETGLGSEGPAGAPGSDRERFDPEYAYQSALSVGKMSFGEGAALGLLAPLRLLSFWKMKDRACKFGERGAFALLARMGDAKPTARIHIVGHSFGCIVASAMICGPGSRSELRRQVDSLALLQGAMSLWSYCPDIPVARGKSGYFYEIVARHCVRGPIVTTQSEHDTAARIFYPAGAGVADQVSYAPGELPRYGAVGAFGIQGLEQKVINMPMHAIDAAYNFRPGAVYNLESTAYIREGSGLSGAHSDIARPEVAHAIWEAARQ